MKRLLVPLALILATCPAFAQEQSGAFPSTIASSSLTQAQRAELERRLAALQGRFQSLSSETRLRASAVQNIAVEIFGAQPGLDFETYTTLIENGARELQRYITDASARTDPDPAAAALRQRAIAAAQDGRLTEARSLYDQLIAANRAARQRTRDQEDLADAADMAESARLAYVAADYLDAARRYEQAAALAPESARHQRWLYRALSGDSFAKRGELFNEPEYLRDAVEILRAALELAPRDVAASDWAQTQNDLGIALQILGARGDAQAIRDSITAFRAALEVRRRADSPAAWGDTQSNLGAALQVLGEQGDEVSLNDAVLAYRAALEVRTRATYPTAWAATMNNLATALTRIGQLGDQAALRDGVAAYRAALEVRTREVVPVDWAATQNNLGVALTSLGQQGDEQALRDAISAFQSALEVYSRSNTPADWAMTEMNLGNALLARGVRGGEQPLREAVSAFQRALEVYSSASTPGYWVRAQIGLGAALVLLGERGDDQALRDAVESYRAALTVRTSVPYADWTLVQINMGLALATLGEHGDQQALRDSVAVLRAALASTDRARDQIRWANVQNAICYTLSFAGERENSIQLAQQLLANGIIACNSALTVATRDENPSLWAATQDSLGRVYEILGDRGGGVSNYDMAIQHYRLALEVFTAASASPQHQATAASLARVQARRNRRP